MLPTTTGSFSRAGLRRSWMYTFEGSLGRLLLTPTGSKSITELRRGLAASSLFASLVWRMLPTSTASFSRAGLQRPLTVHFFSQAVADENNVFERHISTAGLYGVLIVCLPIRRAFSRRTVSGAGLRRRFAASVTLASRVTRMMSHRTCQWHGSSLWYTCDVWKYQP